MNQSQNDFEAALRISGISIDTKDIPLIFELANACNGKELYLQDWAKIFSKHASDERKEQLAKHKAKTAKKPDHTPVPCEYKTPFILAA